MLNPQPMMRRQYDKVTYWYTGADALKEGETLAFDHDSTSTTAGPLALSGLSDADKQVANRTLHVEKCGFVNLITRRQFAGFVAPGTYVPPDYATRGGYAVQVYPSDQAMSEVYVYTDENVTAGDVLGPIPGSHSVGRGVIHPCLIAIETVDRSGTAGLVRCSYQPWLNWANLPTDKMYRFFDDFAGDKNIFLGGATPAEVIVPGYLLSGATVAGAWTGDAGGRLVITPTTTTIAQLNLGAVAAGTASGMACLPITLGTGKNCFFRANVNFGVGAVDNDVFCGLAITGAAVTDGTVPALNDYLGFYMQGDSSALINIATNRDNGTDNVTSTGVSQVADAMHDLAFLVRNRLAGDAAGATEILVWVDGVLTNTLNSAAVNALINKDAAMGLVFAGIGGAAAVALEIDRWEVVMNR